MAYNGFISDIILYEYIMYKRYLRSDKYMNRDKDNHTRKKPRVHWDNWINKGSLNMAGVQ